MDEASKEKPYFGLRLNLDPALVTSVMMEAGIETRKGDASIKAIGVNAVDADLLDAVVRLVRLTDKPGEQNILTPLIKRESSTGCWREAKERAWATSWVHRGEIRAASREQLGACVNITTSRLRSTRWRASWE